MTFGGDAPRLTIHSLIRGASGTVDVVPNGAGPETGLEGVATDSVCHLTATRLGAFLLFVCDPTADRLRVFRLTFAENRWTQVLTLMVAENGQAFRAEQHGASLYFVAQTRATERVLFHSEDDGTTWQVSMIFDSALPLSTVIWTTNGASLWVADGDIVRYQINDRTRIVDDPPSNIRDVIALVNNGRRLYASIRGDGLWYRYL